MKGFKKIRLINTNVERAAPTLVKIGSGTIVQIVEYKLSIIVLFFFKATLRHKVNIMRYTLYTDMLTNSVFLSPL